MSHFVCEFNQMTRIVEMQGVVPPKYILDNAKHTNKYFKKVYTQGSADKPDHNDALYLTKLSHRWYSVRRLCDDEQSCMSVSHLAYLQLLLCSS